MHRLINCFTVMNCFTAMKDFTAMNHFTAVNYFIPVNHFTAVNHFIAVQFLTWGPTQPGTVPSSRWAIIVITKKSDSVKKELASSH